CRPACLFEPSLRLSLPEPSPSSNRDAGGMPRDDFSTVPAARGPLPWLRCGILSVSTTEVANAWRLRTRAGMREHAVRASSARGRRRDVGSMRTLPVSCRTVPGLASGDLSHQRSHVSVLGDAGGHAGRSLRPCTMPAAGGPLCGAVPPAGLRWLAGDGLVHHAG